MRPFNGHYTSGTRCNCSSRHSNSWAHHFRRIGNARPALFAFGVNPEPKAQKSFPPPGRSATKRRRRFDSCFAFLTNPPAIRPLLAEPHLQPMQAGHRIAAAGRPAKGALAAGRRGPKLAMGRSRLETNRCRSARSEPKVFSADSGGHLTTIKNLSLKNWPQTHSPK